MGAAPVLPLTPRLGGDRFGFLYGRLGCFGVYGSFFRRSRLAISYLSDSSQTSQLEHLDIETDPHSSLSPSLCGFLLLATPAHLGKRVAPKPLATRKKCVVLAETKHALATNLNTPLWIRF